MAKLTFVLEDGQEVVVPLTERVTIGRAEDNDVMVDDERISVQHAELLQNADGSIQVFDLNSESGTFVNGERQKSCTLLHGDQLAFGPLMARLDLEEMEVPAETSATPPHEDRGHAEEMARLEAEKARLKAAVDAVAKDLRDWEKRAEKERALHLSRIESLRAEEEQLAPLQTAVRDAEAAHREWMEAISTLSAQHQDKTSALERLNAQHVEKSAEVTRLTAEADTATREVEALTARLKQVRDECEQDETLLNSLRQQIIKLEENVKEEEARQSSLAASGAELAKKKQKEEAAVKDLESLLMKLEQQGAAAEGGLQRKQEELAACDKKLADQKNKLEAENRRLEEVAALRAEIERECQELAAVKQQLADARQRLAAVEKRQQSVLAAADGNAPQLASPKRKAAKNDSPDTAATESRHQDIMRQIEAARQELGELQGRITATRDARASLPQPPAEAENAAGIPAPVIVQVDPVVLKPVSMKSERSKASAAAKVKAKNA